MRFVEICDLLSFQIEAFLHKLTTWCKKKYIYMCVFIICVLSSSWSISWSRVQGALLHLVLQQQELQDRVSVLLDGLFHSFLQQVAFCLYLCVLLPCHCFHGGLQKPQAYQHRALSGRWNNGREAQLEGTKKPFEAA